MVVFTCNHCGESLQKPRVEKHYSTICRRNPSLTCVDCLKDFIGEAFYEHTKCLTEEERYAAKGSAPNGFVKKGEKKQESWCELVKEIIATNKDVPVPIRNLLNIISTSTNIPRKKPQFCNFVRNINKGRLNMNDINVCWDILENALKKPTSTSQNDVQKRKAEDENENVQKKLKSNINDATYKQEQPETNENGSKNDEDTVSEITEVGTSEKKKKKKEKHTEIVDAVIDTTAAEKKKNKKSKENGDHTPNIVEFDDNNEKHNSIKKNKKQEIQEINQNSDEIEQTLDMTVNKFQWEENILNLLMKKNQMTKEKLQKKILAKYQKLNGELENEKKLIKKFNKKLTKITDLEIKEDLIILKH